VSRKINSRTKFFFKNAGNLVVIYMTGWAPVIQLPELQSLLYQQEGDTLFTVEYDIARQVTFTFFVQFVSGLECFGHSFAYEAHL
jgi:hypothetical protein